jgi:HlyD family type I secretion membrane fusion protein
VRRDHPAAIRAPFAGGAALIDREDREAAAMSRFTGLTAAGVAIVAVFFGAFGGWAALAPLDSAAIAPGIIAVDTKRKLVQHLEGGIVERILVREGDKVTKGQTLIALDQTQARAGLDVLRGRLIAAVAQESRLIAERDQAAGVRFPAWLEAARGSPAVDEAMAGELRILADRREGLAGQIAILEQKAAKAREEIVGLRGQIAAENRQIALLNSEISDIGQLVDQGLAPRPRLLALQRRSAEISGSRSQHYAAIARAEQEIAETELRVTELRKNAAAEAVGRLREIQGEIFNLTDRSRAAEDVLARTVVVAPVDGTVLGSQAHTVGGVIAPGAPIMEIVPGDDRLLIDAQIDPADIDVVRVGLPARVRLSALPQRHLAPLSGEVVSISADRLVDPQSGRSYFGARIVLHDDGARLPSALRLYPGMQAEVTISTGMRTLLDYIAEPIFRSLNRAFREN